MPWTRSQNVSTKIVFMDMFLEYGYGLDMKKGQRDRTNPAMKKVHNLIKHGELLNQARLFFNIKPI